jgi:hypothetical protein
MVLDPFQSSHPSRHSLCTVLFVGSIFCTAGTNFEPQYAWIHSN